MPPRRAGPSAAQGGCVPPGRPLLQRRPDPHLLLALAFAAPVWVLFASGAAGALRVPAGAWGWLSLLLVQPLLEELVFRGLLQGQALRLLAVHGQPRRVGPLSWANVLVTVLFVVLHLPGQPVAWAAAVAAPSLVFGHLRERFGSVAVPIAAHAIYNAGFGVAAVVAAGG